jgi:D-beta-D-heptose 7-phosphate kinase/D-beta-D-heptose 1-phosphate adenosyltransferase
MYEDLLKKVTSLGSPKVMVVGDFMLDIYVYGDAARISPEAPVPVLRVTETEYRCGGAGSVASNLAALGAAPLCIGVIGEDRHGEILIKELEAAGADTGGLLRLADRPTISKQRLIGLAQHRHRQQLIRIDRESTEALGQQRYEQVLEAYEDRLSRADIVCLQDYNKGLLTDPVCRQMVELARQSHKKVLVDPCLTSDYAKYTGSTLITPNRKEASAASDIEVTDSETASRAADELMRRLRLEAVVITLDKEGAYLRTRAGGELIGTRARSVYDVTGAGDMVLSALAISLAAGNDYKTAVRMANIAGGIEVEKFGTSSVTVGEIVGEIIGQRRGKGDKVRAADSLLEELAAHRGQHRKVVFTNGCFDIVHRGHTEYLDFCKSQGDIVVVGLNSDASVKKIKGQGRPINDERDRAAVLAALESVDYVAVFDEPTPLNLIKKVRPDILVKGEDWAQKGVVGREFVESYGGKVVLAPLVDGRSSTATIEKLKSLEVKS